VAAESADRGAACRGELRSGILEGVAEDASPGTEPAAADSGQERSFGDLQYYVPQDVLDVSFPVAVRGYDRRAVDAYIKRVNRVIAELKVRSSPPAAVRHALEEAEGTVQELLQAARSAAGQITSSAQQESEENTQRAKAEAATLIVDTNAEADRMKAEADEHVANAKRQAEETVATARANADELVAGAKAQAEDIVTRAQAEADERLKRLEEDLTARREEAESRMRELQSDTETIWNERHELLDDIHRMSGSLVELATAAAARIQREGDAPVGESEPLSADDEPTRIIEPHGQEEAESQERP
jgi:DivIVA domain-containing protein